MGLRLAVRVDCTPLFGRPAPCSQLVGAVHCHCTVSCLALLLQHSLVPVAVFVLGKACGSCCVAASHMSSSDRLALALRSDALLYLLGCLLTLADLVALEVRCYKYPNFT